MEENIKTEKNQEVQEDKKGFRIRDLFQGLHVKDIFLGRFISNDILIRQWKRILVIVILLFIYISNRYTCQQKITQIGELQKQLVDVRYEALTLSSKLMGSSRQSQVEKLIESKGLDLHQSKQPPFNLVKKNHGNR